MLEAIGERQSADRSSRRATACSSPTDGACIQTILVPDHRFATATARAPDWIERYVFPGCLIPSLGALASGGPVRRRSMLHERRRDRRPLRRDAASLARELPRPDRRGAAPRLRRALRTHLGLLPRVLRGGVPPAALLRRQLSWCFTSDWHEPPRMGHWALRCSAGPLALLLLRRSTSCSGARRTRPLVDAGWAVSLGCAPCSTQCSAPAELGARVLIAMTSRARARPHRLLVGRCSGAGRTVATPSSARRWRDAAASS